MIKQARSKEERQLYQKSDTAYSKFITDET